MSRPSDAQDEFAVDRGPLGPRLGPIEWLRWAWRQLTSMRTALLLLLAVAIAAVPGSLISQNSSDPNGVALFRANNSATVVRIVEFFQLFDVYTSVWFSAIYILLFISLVGCVVPRARHHFAALRARPPRTPSRFDRLPARSSTVLAAGTEEALAAATRVLKNNRYRVERYGASVSAERGYLRETGNLVFHSALVGVLITVFIGGGFTYTGQKALTVGSTFVNLQSNYDSFFHGRFFSAQSLQPYSLKLDRLDVTYEQQNPNAFGQPLDYTAHVTTFQDGVTKQSTIKVNEPLTIGGTQVYLLGNGYAPVISVTNADGSLAFPSQPVVFLPQGASMRSLGVVKATDTTDPKKQIGLNGFLYPTPVVRDGQLDSIYPGVGKQSLITLNVYEGDLGTSDGSPQNAYELDTSKMTLVAGRDAKTELPAIQLSPSSPTATLPDGLGTVHLDGIVRYAGLDIHHDPSQGWVALFVGLAVLGLIVSLLVPRRRMWVKVTDEADGRVTVEYAALARGDDPNLDRAVAELERDHRAALGAAREPGPA